MRRILTIAATFVFLFASQTSNADAPAPSTSASSAPAPTSAPSAPTTSILDDATCTVDYECSAACNSGNIPACYKYAKLNMEEYPEGSPQRGQALFAFFDVACQKGSSNACNLLAYAYSRGVGYAPNRAAKIASLYQREATLLLAACDANDAKACGMIAERYSGDEGNSFPQDWAKAFTFATKSCDLGRENGCYVLGFIYDRGKLVPKDAVKARALFTKACGMGSGPACTEIGNHQKACSLGEEDSCDTLCKAGNTASCAHASQALKDEMAAKQAEAEAKRDKAAAPGKFAALIQKCAANRVVIEQSKVAGFQAARSGNQAAAQAARARMEALEPQWSATLSELRRLITVISDDEQPKFGQLLIQVRNNCSCDPDPRRPGGYCRRY